MAFDISPRLRRTVLAHSDATVTRGDFFTAAECVAHSGPDPGAGERTPGRRSAAAQRYAGVALAASVALGVAIALFVRPEPDLSGMSTHGVEGRVDNAVRERICTLARAGNYREAQAEFDKLVRRGGEPATAAQVDALCHP